MDKEIKNAFQTFRRTFESRLNYPEKESSEVVNAAQSGLALLEELEVALKKKDAKEVFWITGAVVDCWHTCKYSGLINTGQRQSSGLRKEKIEQGDKILWAGMAHRYWKENPGLSLREVARRIDESMGSNRFESIRKELAPMYRGNRKKNLGRQ